MEGATVVVEPALEESAEVGGEESAGIMENNRPNLEKNGEKEAEDVESGKEREDARRDSGVVIV